MHLYNNIDKSYFNLTIYCKFMKKKNDCFYIRGTNFYATEFQSLCIQVQKA